MWGRNGDNSMNPFLDTTTRLIEKYASVGSVVSLTPKKTYGVLTPQSESLTDFKYIEKPMKDEEKVRLSLTNASKAILTYSSYGIQKDNLIIVDSERFIVREIVKYSSSNQPIAVILYCERA